MCRSPPSPPSHMRKRQKEKKKAHHIEHAPIVQPQIASSTHTHQPTTPRFAATPPKLHTFEKSLPKHDRLSKKARQPTRIRVLGPAGGQPALIAPRAPAAAANVRPRPGHEEGCRQQESGGRRSPTFPPLPSLLPPTGQTHNTRRVTDISGLLSGWPPQTQDQLATSEWTHGRQAVTNTRFSRMRLSLGRQTEPFPRLEPGGGGLRVGQRAAWRAVCHCRDRFDPIQWAHENAWTDNMQSSSASLLLRLTPPARRPAQPSTTNNPTRLRNLYAGSPMASPKTQPPASSVKPFPALPRAI